MRLTPSSSLLLATLALSSSSSTLAAPTDGGDHHGISASASMHTSGRRESVSMHMGAGDTSIAMDDNQPPSAHHDVGRPEHGMHQAMVMAKRDNPLLSLINGLPLGLGSILGPLIEKILGISGGGASVLTAMSPEEIDNIQSVLQAAVASVLPALPSLPTGAVPSLPVGAIPSLPTGALPSLPTGALPALPTGALPSLPAGAPGPAGNTGKRAVQWDAQDPQYASTTANCTAMPMATNASSTAWSSGAMKVGAMGFPTPPVSPPITPPGNGSLPLPAGLNPLSPPMPVNPPNTPVPLPVSPGDTEALGVPAGVPVPSGLPLPVSPPALPPLSPPVSPPAAPRPGTSASNSSAAPSGTPAAVFDAQSSGDDSDAPPLFASSTANWTTSTWSSGPSSTAS